MQTTSCSGQPSSDQPWDRRKTDRLAQFGHGLETSRKRYTDLSHESSSWQRMDLLRASLERDAEEFEDHD